MSIASHRFGVARRFGVAFAAAATLAAVPGAPLQAQTTSRIVVRAAGSVAGGVWPLMELRVDGAVVGRAVVASAQMSDYAFDTPRVGAGTRIDVVFTNDAVIAGQDRNLLVGYVSNGTQTVLPTMPGATLDRGVGARAFDGIDVIPGQGGIYWSGALRLTWPVKSSQESNLAARAAAARLQLQATFGPRPAELDTLAHIPPVQWIAGQMAMPYKADFVEHVQAKWNQGLEYRPGGAKYTDAWVGERFWATAVTAPDQLRKRVAFALHHMLMVSQADSNLYRHSRAFAHYYDTLNRHAFGSYRALMEDIALSPAMGLYLSHLRNRKEDPASGRMPDENFARELMQLFTIGLHELNADGTVRLDATGKPIETYSNADVQAMAKVFTGYSWGFPDNELTDSRFRGGNIDYQAMPDRFVDLQRMKQYPGQGSTSEVRLFAGKPWALTIPAGTAHDAKLRAALDTLFNHPNVGPFVGRRLIQQLVTSEPSPGYVARVAAAFADNGQGVRGDMAAVVSAVLLDAEARSAAPSRGFGKLREPILRVTQWLRAFEAASPSGEYRLAWELDALSQRAMRSPSVFGWFRPGYVPPGTAFAAAHATAPEFQIVNETTTAAWANTAQQLAGRGIGWNGSSADAASAYTRLVAMAKSGNAEAMVQHLNVLLFAGSMSAALRQDILDAVASVGGTHEESHLNRARIAVFIAMASPEFLVQR